MRFQGRFAALRGAPTRWARDKDGAEESGQTTILIIGYLLLSLLVIAAVTAASAVYLGHKRLLSVADSASAFAADSFSFVAGAESTAFPGVSLSDERVRNAARRYLEENRTAESFDRLGLAERTGSPDSISATVVLTAVVRLPVVGLLLPEGIQITASSTARPQLRR